MFSDTRCPGPTDGLSDSHWPELWVGRRITRDEPDRAKCSKCGQKIYRVADELLWRSEQFVIAEESLD